MLSHAYWQTAFGGRADVLGETMIVNGQTLTIVGVAPAGFDGHDDRLAAGSVRADHDALADAAGTRPDHANRRSYWIYLFARMKPGVTIDQARAAINVPYRAIINDVEVPLNRTMSDQVMARFKKKLIVVEPGQRGQSNVARDTHDAADAAARRHTARAADRLRQHRESAAGARGRAVERDGHAPVDRREPPSVDRAAPDRVVHARADWRRHQPARGAVDDGLDRVADSGRRRAAADAAGRDGADRSTAALAIGTSVLVGLFPALHATRPDVVSALKGQSGQPAGGRGAARFRTTLATAQIALSMVLVVLAGLFTKSLDNIGRVDPRMNLDGLITFEIAPERNAYTQERTALLVERLEDELRALPGVTGAASSQMALLAERGYLGLGQGRGIRRRSGRGSRHQLRRGQSRLLPHAGRAADRRARVHARRRAEGGESRDRQRDVREEIRSRARRGREARGTQDG